MSKVENRIHHGRNLTGYTDDQGQEWVGWPQVAYEAIRAINHLTLGTAMPAPTVYRVLDGLKGVGHLLPPALGQVGEGLARSLTEYDVYDGRATGPAQSVQEARQYLAEAAEAARLLGVALEAAQSAIAEQGYTERSTSIEEGDQ